MANPLYAIPGLGGYQAAVDANQQRGLQQLQQAQAVMGIQKAQQQQQQQAQYQADVAALGPNPSPEALAGVVAKYNPEKALDIRQRAEDRKSLGEERARQFAETLELKRQGLEQQRVAFEQRTTDAQARAQFDQWMKQQQLILQQQNQAFQKWATEQNLDIKKLLAENKPITEFQGKNALYGSRAAASDRTLNGLEDKISLVGLATKESIQNMPVVGGALGAVANKALSADQQKVEQAQRDFVNAVLRQESGAVISAQEFDNAKKQYFPQPGDSKEVIAQKKSNRKLAIEGFKRIAGPAWASVEQQLQQSNIAAPAPTGNVVDFGSLK